MVVDTSAIVDGTTLAAGSGALWEAVLWGAGATEGMPSVVRSTLCCIGSARAITWAMGFGDGNGAAALSGSGASLAAAGAGCGDAVRATVVAGGVTGGA